MPLAPGARIGPYEVVALIGTGGMGEVYRATDARLHRDVAINREGTPVLISTATGLAEGTYCDLISGGKVGGACAGTSIVVNAGGAVSFTLPSNHAVAVEVGGRL